MYSWNIFLWLVAVIVIFSAATGLPVQNQPLVTGAASLLTIPLNLALFLALSPIGWLLLPLIFIAFVYYFRALHQHLGTDVLYFIAAAALFVVLVG